MPDILDDWDVFSTDAAVLASKLVVPAVIVLRLLGIFLDIEEIVMGFLLGFSFVFGGLVVVYWSFWIGAILWKFVTHAD